MSRCVFTPPRSSLLLAVLLVVGASCDGNRRVWDASAPATERTAEIAIRVDVAAGGATMSVLAFRASVAGVALGEVLGFVDPLAARAPDGRCALLDVDVAARRLRAAGGAIDLEEIGGIEVQAADRSLRPAPRLYPDIATVVAGVVAESGPAAVPVVPDTVRLYLSERGGVAVEIAVPSAPRVESVGGIPPAPHAPLGAGDLDVVVAGGPGTTVEIRPYGATAAVSCPVGPSGRVLIPGALLERIAGGGRIAVSLDAVSTQAASLRLPGDGFAARVSVEIRRSLLMELGS